MSAALLSFVQLRFLCNTRTVVLGESHKERQMVSTFRNKNINGVPTPHFEYRIASLYVIGRVLFER